MDYLIKSVNLTANVEHFLRIEDDGGDWPEGTSLWFKDMNRATCFRDRHIALCLARKIKDEHNALRNMSEDYPDLRFYVISYQEISV